MRKIKDYKKIKTDKVVKTVNIDLEQSRKIDQYKINFSELVRDLLNEFFKTKEGK